MSAPARLLLSTQGTPTGEQQHRQASNNAALNKDRIRIRSYRGRVAVLPYYAAGEIEIARTGRQVKVGVADPYCLFRESWYNQK